MTHQCNCCPFTSKRNADLNKHIQRRHGKSIDIGSCVIETILASCVSHSAELQGYNILQMTRILFPGRTDPAPKIFAIEGNPTPP